MQNGLAVGKTCGLSADVLSVLEGHTRPAKGGISSALRSDRGPCLGSATLGGRIGRGGGQGAAGRRGNAIDAGASLWNADLSEADLNDADPADVEGLQVVQLRGATVSLATLPDAVGEFAGLDTAKATTQPSKELFVSVLVACAYAPTHLRHTPLSRNWQHLYSPKGAGPFGPPDDDDLHPCGRRRVGGGDKGALTERPRQVDRANPLSAAGFAFARGKPNFPSSGAPQNLSSRKESCAMHSASSRRLNL